MVREYCGSMACRCISVRTLCDSASKRRGGDMYSCAFFTQQRWKCCASFGLVISCTMQEASALGAAYTRRCLVRVISAVPPAGDAAALLDMHGRGDFRRSAGPATTPAYSDSAAYHAACHPSATCTSVMSSVRYKYEGLFLVVQCGGCASLCTQS